MGYRDGQRNTNGGFLDDKMPFKSEDSILLLYRKNFGEPWSICSNYIKTMGGKIDKKGNLFATGPGGVLIISPEGKLLGRIDTNEPTANCAWGDDGSTLYITSNMHLCRIKTLTVGVGF